MREIKIVNREPNNITQQHFIDNETNKILKLIQILRE